MFSVCFQFLPHLVFCNFYSCLYPLNDPNYMNGCEVWGWSSVFLYTEYTKRKWLFIIFVMNMPYISGYCDTKCFWNTGNIVSLVVWKMVLPVVMSIRGQEWKWRAGWPFVQYTSLLLCLGEGCEYSVFVSESQPLFC